MKLLQETLKQARRRGGIISREEVAENFEKLSLDKEQLDQVEAYLKAHKITVGVTSGNEEDLPEEERDFLESYMEMTSWISRNCIQDRESAWKSWSAPAMRRL